MTIGILLALLAAVGYGTSDFIGGFGAGRVSPWAVAFTGQLAGAAAIVGVGLAMPGTPSPRDFGWAALAGIGGAIGSAFLYRGLASGSMGTAAPVSAVGAAILPVLVGSALGERPTSLVWLGVLVALPGIWLVARESGGDPVAGRRPAMIDGGIAGLGFGCLFVATAQIPSSAGVLPLAASQLIGAVVIAVIATVLRRPWRSGVRHLHWGVVAGALGAVGTCLYLAATQAADLGVTAVLTSLFPAITVLLAVVFLKERIRPTQRLGLATCGAAVVLVAIG
ncbi:DMT family transporter [Streptomyces sp. IB201691-2A2]|uniref:DMT family transporter n=1 Tax=Streptomyces sp. IB201691-2A2 TaxID=2561920 RepID=UPI001CA778E5|nr:EamA family transporter [Streptomyces sp. IB201691-2A2]